MHIITHVAHIQEASATAIDADLHRQRTGIIIANNRRKRVHKRVGASIIVDNGRIPVPR